jgi:putative flippase GtrA
MTFLWSKYTANLDRYVLASVLANAFAYSLYALISVLEITTEPVIAFLAASILSFPLSFYLNRIWVFKSNNNHLRELLRFSFGYAVALICGALLLHILLVLINNPYLAQFISMIILGSSAFLLHSLWTFRERNLST